MRCIAQLALFIGIILVFLCFFGEFSIGLLLLGIALIVAAYLVRPTLQITFGIESGPLFGYSEGSDGPAGGGDGGGA